ncbi:MAG TPA: hypothetical protein VFQ44_27520 [Streptosporangiaceae bacterium]|nr:hypothetical protein [Streptosporangiaceae bacterium]
MTGPGSAWSAELTYFRDVTEIVPAEAENAARECIAAWAIMVAAGKSDSPVVSGRLLRPGGPEARTKVVVRDPRICRIQISRVDPDPPALGLVVDIQGRRCVIDSDTGEPVSGNPAQQTWFYEFWNLVRDGHQPWRLTPGQDPHDPSYSCLPSSGQRDQPRVFIISCGFVEDSVHYGSSVSISVRLTAPPARDVAVQLVLPAIYSQLTAFNGLSDWRPSLTGLEVRAL